MTRLAQLTDEQLGRAYRAAYWRMRKRFKGGDSFGVDRPTLALIAPRWLATLDALRREMERRQ